MVGAANDLNISENGFQSFNNTNGVFHGRTLTAGTGITITNGDGLSANPVIGLTGAAPITAIQGDAGSPVSGSTIQLFGSSGSANAGGSVVFGSSSATELDLQLTDSDGNTFLGESAGNSTLVGSGNTSVGQSSSQSIIGASATTACGFEALQDNVSGNLNTAFGFRALTSNIGGVSNVGVGGGTLQSSTGDSFNVAIGDLSLFALDGGDQNTCVGGNSGVNLDTGQFNIMLGYNAGSSLVGAESSNILFGNPGIISESNAIRIGQQGSGANQQNACFIAGINGVTTSNTRLVTINSSTGQLGSMPTSSIQQIRSRTVSLITCSTTIPIDDSIPQIGEGTQVLTATITPTNSASILVIQFVGWGSPDGTAYTGTALFQDATADALAAYCQYNTSGLPSSIQLTHYMTAGTTSATTFQIRVGPDAGNFYLNGISGSRFYGGVSEAVLLVTEYAA